MNYLEFAQEMQQQDEDLEIFGGVEKTKIEKAEKELSILFPSEYILYLSECGSCGYSDSYISGLFKEWDNFNSTGSTLNDTIKARSNHNLPEDYIVLEYEEDDNYYVLKVSKDKRLNDSEVYSVDIDSNGELKKFHKIFDSFEKYFKHSIEAE